MSVFQTNENTQETAVFGLLLCGKIDKNDASFISLTQV